MTAASVSVCQDGRSCALGAPISKLLCKVQRYFRKSVASPRRQLSTTSNTTIFSGGFADTWTNDSYGAIGLGLYTINYGYDKGNALCATLPFPGVSGRYYTSFKKSVTSGCVSAFSATSCHFHQQDVQACAYSKTH